MFDVAVVGKGLIGSAAGRYLSQQSDNIAIIGPDEPAEPWCDHNGVFASHYDEGRITRALDSSQLWAELAINSIAEYRAIEAASGIPFYTPCGGIQIGPPQEAQNEYMMRTQAVADALGTEYRRYSGAEFRTVCPELQIAERYTVLHEPTVAGYINPRPLVKAQLKIAEQQGATILRETVTGLKSQPDGVTLTTDAGREIRAKRLLLTTGAWSEFLSGHELGLVPTPRTIVMARVSQAEAHRLRHLPSIIFYAGLDNPNLTGIYMLPPIRYPDGEMYIKIGGRLNEVAIPQSAAELTEWFQGQGSQLEAESLASELFSIVRDLIVEATVIKPCVVTQTNSMEPLIEAIEPGHGGLGRIVVAAGGCGAAAKSSNEIGRLAALKMVG